jgi:hypothetical protein
MKCGAQGLQAVAATTRPAGIPDQLWAIACHESSHEVAARYFGLPALAVATESRGTCLHPRLREPWHLHANAVIGWAGWVGECLVTGRLIGTKTPDVKLDRDAVRAWAGEIAASYFNSHPPPPKDWQDITHGVPWPLTPDALRACEQAFEIVSPNLDLITERAGTLCHLWRERPRGMTDAQVVAQFEEMAERAL